MELTILAQSIDLEKLAQGTVRRLAEVMDPSMEDTAYQIDLAGLVTAKPMREQQHQCQLQSQWRLHPSNGAIGELSARTSTDCILRCGGTSVIHTHNGGRTSRSTLRWTNSRSGTSRSRRW